MKYSALNVALQGEQMRNAQNMYFQLSAKAKRTKSPEDYAEAKRVLEISKKLEVVFDNTVQEISEGGHGADFLESHTDFFNLVSEELEAAEAKHPRFPEDILHQVAIVAEESGEVVRATLQHYYESGSVDEVKKELIQTAAMCLRMFKNLPGVYSEEVQS